MAKAVNIYRQIADLHITNLDQSFLATLGPVFLSEVYRAMDRSETGALIYETLDNRAVGFVTGGTSMGPIYKAMLPRIWRWGFPLAVQLLSPRRLMRVIDILRYSEAGESDWPKAELFSIAVDPSARGKGIAPKLYERLNAHFKAGGVDRYRIIVGNDLAPAHGFYKKMGAVLHSELELHSGELSKVYIQTVT